MNIFISPGRSSFRSLPAAFQVEEIESIRASSTSKAQELLADFKEIFSVLPYKTDDDYRFVATTNLTNVIKVSSSSIRYSAFSQTNLVFFLLFLLSSCRVDLS